MRALLIALLVGCVDSAADAPAGKSVPPGPTPAPAVVPALTFAADDPAALEVPVTSFSLATLHHLMIRYRVPQLGPDVTWVTLSLEAPDGAVWTTRHLAFSAGHARALVNSPDGVPHAIDVTPAHVVMGGHALDTFILVGGTNLQRRAQFGRWTVRATIDQKPDSAAVAAFNLVR